VIIDIVSPEPSVPKDPIDIPDNNFLFKFIKDNNINNYHLMRSWKHSKTHQEIIDRERWIIFNKDNKLFYKISIIPLSNDTITFLNNAHFSNHLVSATPSTIKSSQPNGDIFSNILLTETNENVIFDVIKSIMLELKWVNTEAKRIFSNKKYLDLRFDWFGPNMVYDKNTKKITSIDFEDVQWVSKDEYNAIMIKRLIQALDNWSIYYSVFNTIYYNYNIINYLNYCKNFIENEIQ